MDLSIVGPYRQRMIDWRRRSDRRQPMCYAINDMSSQ